MCIFSKPDIPEPKPLPPVPTVNDEAVKQREAEEARLLQQSRGTAATVKTDLAPSSVAGQRKVLLGV